jgi:hypothetical protein
MINDVRCTHEIKSRIAMAKAAFNNKSLFNRKLDLHLMKKLVKCYIRSIAFYGAGSWTFQKVDQKYLESFEMTRLDKAGEYQSDQSCEKEEVLHRVKEDRNILHTMKMRQANWIGHILLRNCLPNHSVQGKIEGRMEVVGR